jgi:hypothetical protein
MTDEPDKQTADNGDDGRDEHGQFAEGNTGGPGRPKGKPNKINAVLKDNILQAYQQRGGVEWLKGLKDRDFVGLLEKTMPREVSADVRAQVDLPLPPFVLVVPCSPEPLPVPGIEGEVVQPEPGELSDEPPDPSRRAGIVPVEPPRLDRSTWGNNR